jgi:RNA polymerase sigma-70 factor (ECF subfamily)
MSSSADAHILSVAGTLGEIRVKDSAPPVELPLKELEDEKLISRLQQGDLRAFEALFDRYAGLLLGVGSRILRDTAEAEDLVQEVFLYLFRKNRLFDFSKGSVRSWLIQATYSRAFNRYKYLKTRLFYVKEDFEAASTKVCDDSALNPEEMFYWRSLIHQVFLSLPDEQRTTLHLHFFEGYTLVEISHKLGQSFGNVRHYYYRGLERLRKRLSEDDCSQARRE